MNFRSSIFLVALEMLTLLFVSTLGFENNEDAPKLIEEPMVVQVANDTEDDKQFLLCFGRPCHRFSATGDTCCKGFRCMAHLHLGGICIRGQPYDHTITPDPQQQYQQQPDVLVHEIKNLTMFYKK